MKIIERVTICSLSWRSARGDLTPALLLVSSLLGIETRCDNNKNNNTNDYLLTDYQV